MRPTCDLLSLNDDVLIEVFSYLYGSDSINMGLTCKQAYAFAVPRYMAHSDTVVGPGSVVRGQYLRYLVVSPTALLPSRVESFPVVFNHFQAIQVEQGWQMFDTRIVPYLCTLLEQARNLRYLHLGPFTRLLAADTRVGAALQQMCQLTDLHLDEAAIQYAQVLSWNANGEHTSPTFVTLLEAISAFPALNALALVAFQPLVPLLFADISPLPSFASITCLQLSHCTPCTLALVPLFPRLQVLGCTISGLGAVPEHWHALGTGGSWRPLRQLVLFSKLEVVCVLDAVAQVHDLTITTELRLGGFTIREETIAILQRTNPVCLDMAVSFGPVRATIWEDIAPVAPRLRFLELRVSHLRPEIRSTDWLDNIPTALAPLTTLSYLRLIFLSRTTSCAPTPTVSAPADPSGQEAQQDVSHAVATQRALYALPRRLAYALPSLQCVALSLRSPVEHPSGSPGLLTRHWAVVRADGGDEDAGEAQIELVGLARGAADELRARFKESGSESERGAEAPRA
ncbi:hypothetical protein BD413DRAFT_613398 [Trametes elegans]|nr:hypothetical protein BD413DRAFT_613398 [Trametes elegans]